MFRNEFAEIKPEQHIADKPAHIMKASEIIPKRFSPKERLGAAARTTTDIDRQFADERITQDLSPRIHHAPHLLFFDYPHLVALEVIAARTKQRQIYLCRNRLFGSVDENGAKPTINSLSPPFDQIRSVSGASSRHRSLRNWYWPQRNYLAIDMRYRRQSLCLNREEI